MPPQTVRSAPRAESLTPSLLSLLAANLVPLYGVVFLEWPVFPVMLLFWLENVIIGAFNVLKMLLASPGGPSRLARLFNVGFFCVHYGGFTSTHGLFVMMLFGGFADPDRRPADVASVWHALARLEIGWAVLALFLSHAASFAWNYIGRGEYRTASLRDLMLQPYGRVLLLHATLLAGGSVVVFLGAPVVALLLLVVLKTLLDATAHVREHRARAPEPVRQPA